MFRTGLLRTARCLDADSERSYQDLFERLDTNKDGKVDVAELRAGLKAMGIFRHGAAQVILMMRAGSSCSSAEYMSQHVDIDFLRWASATE